jgi:predicted lipase
MIKAKEIEISMLESQRAEAAMIASAAALVEKQRLEDEAEQIAQIKQAKEAAAKRDAAALAAAEAEVYICI